MGVQKDKPYGLPANLIFFSIVIVLVITLAALGASIVINKGPVLPLLGIAISTHVNNSGSMPSTIITKANCSPYNTSFSCENPSFNYSSGVFTVSLEQNTGYNWTSVTVQFVPTNANFSHGVPELSWSPPFAVNVTGGLLSNTLRDINIPITSGSVDVGTNITGSIWAKYQLGVGKAQFYANISSAFIVINQSN